MAAKDYRKGGIPYGFVAFPKDVLSDPRYFELQASSKVLLFDVAAQLRFKESSQQVRIVSPQVPQQACAIPRSCGVFRESCCALD